MILPPLVLLLALAVADACDRALAAGLCGAEDGAARSELAGAVVAGALVLLADGDGDADGDVAAGSDPADAGAVCALLVAAVLAAGMEAGAAEQPAASPATAATPITMPAVARIDMVHLRCAIKREPPAFPLPAVWRNQVPCGTSYLA